MGSESNGSIGDRPIDLGAMICQGLFTPAPSALVLVERSRISCPSGGYSHDHDVLKQEVLHCRYEQPRNAHCSSWYKLTRRVVSHHNVLFLSLAPGFGCQKENTHAYHASSCMRDSLCDYGYVAACACSPARNPSYGDYFEYAHWTVRLSLESVR